MLGAIKKGVDVHLTKSGHSCSTHKTCNKPTLEIDGSYSLRQPVRHMCKQSHCHIFHLEQSMELKDEFQDADTQAVSTVSRGVVHAEDDAV